LVSVIIFTAHFIFLAFIVYKKWKTESASSALINALLIIILFSVGWSVTTMLAKMIFDPAGLGEYYKRDDISLTLLALAELFFYKFYYGKEKITAAGKGK